MDFSSLNPVTSNALNLAARNNDVATVERLLKKMNPNWRGRDCLHRRGWTCLHEATANDSYESLLLILKHKDIRPLAETHEGHTALYVACNYYSSSSVKTIKALLDSVPDIANYGTTKYVTPLHISCTRGRNEVIQLLLDYGAIIDVQDSKGDTPLHYAALATEFDTVNLLLHAGANPEVKNEANYSAFHSACFTGCYQTVRNLFLFISDVNQVTVNGDSPLILAAQGDDNDIVIQFLLKNGADPDIKNKYGDTALTMALNMRHILSFNILLRITDLSRIDQNIILHACKPHYFKLEILESLLTYDLNPEFFDFYEPVHLPLERIGGFMLQYLTNAPLNSFLNICEEYIYKFSPEKFQDFFQLFLMKGLSVNALNVDECPPLVYIHYSMHSLCFKDVFNILREHGCDVDYCSAISHLNQKRILPDAFLASIASDPSTSPVMLPYSLHCDAEYLLSFATEYGLLGRFPLHVQEQLLSMIGLNTDFNPESLAYTILPLKHLCRQKIRYFAVKNLKLKPYNQFLTFLNSIRIPRILKEYLCYL